MADTPPDHEPGAAGHKKHSALTYVVIFIVLMVLAGATFALGEGRLGRWSLPFAMGVATIKAGLVVGWFMHLAEHRGAVRVTMAIAVVFIGLLILVSVGDVATRFAPANPRNAPFGIAPAGFPPRQPGEAR